MERLILQGWGSEVFDWMLTWNSAMHKGRKNGFGSMAPMAVEKEIERECPIPDGLPKSLEELEEEERARMPDSPYTRLLRARGTRPAWYSHAPDHETD